MDDSSQPSPTLDDPEEPLPPLRSPSRLDFCLEDFEMDWSTVDDDWWPYTLLDDSEEVVDADITPHTPPHRLNGVVSPPPSDTPLDDDSDSPPMFFAPPDPIEEVVIQHIELQSPVPVRSPAVQMDVDAQEPSVDAPESPPPRITPQRLNYPHHGFSRSALLQQKMLWNSRHAEWMEWRIHRAYGEPDKQGSETNGVYTGPAVAQPPATASVSPPPHPRTPPSGLERDLMNHPPGGRERNVHAPIYPRVGDISALRDPFPANMDRSFGELPLWTLQKTLWAYDLQMKTGSFPPPTPAYNGTNIQASVSVSTLSSYSSSGDDEESDSTLVGDSPVPKGQTLLDPPKGASPPHSPTPSSWNSLCGWKPSWYAKWELLVAIFEGDPTKYAPCPVPSKLEPALELKPAPLTPPTRVFRFTIGDNEDMGDDDDDDDDYGTLVANPSFNVDFDEECDRALAYYNSQSR